MEVKIKSMKYEDFKDNEYIEHLVDELKASHTNVVVGCLDELINWGRSNSLWPLTFATSCCGIEFMSLGAARYAMFYGLMQLQRKVKVEKFFGGVNRQEKREKVFGK